MKTIPLLLMGVVLSGQFDTPRIKVDVNLVSVNVTVTDGRGRYIQGLKKEQFRVWEDKVEQEVGYFSTEDAPISLGIILDKSGSMGDTGRFLEARSSATNCLHGGLREDEYFMIEFNDKPQLVADFTTQMSKLGERLIYVRPGGRTALWDAIYFGISKLEGASNTRTALLVLTDGNENHSRYTLSELKSFLQEKEARIYFFHEGVDQLAALTGGRVFAGRNPCEELKADLSNQYVLGYVPTNPIADGRWREIRVRIDPSSLPKELSGVSVRARAGYYAGGSR